MFSLLPRTELGRSCSPSLAFSLRSVSVGRHFCGALLLALSMLGVPSEGSAAITFDELFRLLVIGKWEQVSDVYAVSKFSASMHYEADIYRSVQKKERLGHLEGVWRVEDGQLHIRLTAAYPPRLPVGVYISEGIDLVDGRRLVLVDAQGERYSKQRLR